MPSNIQANGIDTDTLFAAFVANSPVNNIGYQVAGVDIRTRYDPIANPSQANAGSRIPAIGLRTSATGYAANTDLASIFCGHASQYSLTTPAGGTLSRGAWTTPRTITHTLTVTFSSAAALINYFFYGGRIQISPSKTTGTLADNTLRNMFTSMGTLIIYDTGHYRTGAGGTISNAGIGGSNIGTTLTTLYTINEGSPYSSSTYTVRMQANAPAGSATVLTVTAILSTVTAGVVADSYTGTYTSTVQQRNHPTQAVPTFGGSIT